MSSILLQLGRRIFYGCIILLLVGCSTLPATIDRSSEAKVTIIASPYIHKVTATIFPTNTPVATLFKSPTPIKPTPTPSQSPSPTHPIRLVTRCLELNDKLPLGSDIQGIFVFDSPDPPNNTFGRLMDIQTGKVKDLSKAKGEQLYNFNVSSDGKWLAYQKGRGYFPPPDFQIIIAGADGQKRGEIHPEPSWRGLQGWLDEENLLIDQRGDLHDTLVVFNPFTGQKQSFFAGDYPLILDAFPWIYGGFRPPLMLDPFLSLLVYPGVRPGGSGEVLWDIQSGQEIAFLPSYGARGRPEWSPDGTQVIIVRALTELEELTNELPGDQELFSINREGVATRLTFLTEYYQRVEFSVFSWSPNRRYLAFGLYVEPFQDPGFYPPSTMDLFPNGYPPDDPPKRARLAVLDLNTQVVTNFCVPTNHGWRAPIWSPDSRQLLLEELINFEISRIYLVDIQENFAMQIADDVSLAGWMAVPEK